MNKKIFSISILLFFFDGMAALIFETIWQRMMVLTLGASAYATTAILTSFFIGIAFGSFWRWQSRKGFYLY